MLIKSASRVDSLLHLLRLRGPTAELCCVSSTSSRQAIWHQQLQDPGSFLHRYRHVKPHTMDTHFR